MIDFFCKNMAASKFCDERKSALTVDFKLIKQEQRGHGPEQLH